MPAIGAIIAWIVANPQVIIQGEQAIVNLVQAAIDAWNRHKQGELTDAQLTAAWEAEGIKVQKAIDDWNAWRHPTGATGA